jgi:hypothetical protein
MEAESSWGMMFGTRLDTCLRSSVSEQYMMQEVILELVSLLLFEMVNGFGPLFIRIVLLLFKVNFMRLILGKQTYLYGF